MQIETTRDGRLLLLKIGPLGAYANNAYIVVDEPTAEAIVIDAPEGSEEVVKAAAPFKVQAVVVTHRHRDHWNGIEALLAGIDAPVLTHAADREPYVAFVKGTLVDGDKVEAGNLTLDVVHTPGHTPGGICLRLGEHLLAGDTLFPGGPGRTRTPEDLRQLIESITGRLFTLSDGTRVYPGHGADTTIGASKREYAVFASRPHPPDLCGDVLWLSS